jgi:hypothetical protein
MHVQLLIGSVHEIDRSLSHGASLGDFVVLGIDINASFYILEAAEWGKRSSRHIAVEAIRPNRVRPIAHLVQAELRSIVVREVGDDEALLHPFLALDAFH